MGEIGQSREDMGEGEVGQDREKREKERKRR